MIRRLFCHLEGWRKQGGAGVANLAPRNCVIPTPPFRGVGGWRGGASSRRGGATEQGVETASTERHDASVKLADASMSAAVRNIFGHHGYGVEMIGGAL